MTFTLSEINHMLHALNTMSTYDQARAKELIVNGVTDHNALTAKLESYKYRLQRP